MNHKQSQAIYEEAKQYIPGGVNSPVRSFANVQMTPVFVESGDGEYIKDVDGNIYIDYIGSWGPLILGHNHSIIQEAIKQAMKKGTSFGLPTSIEVDVAKLIVELYPSIDKVRMVNSGTEATMSALRVARGYTKRDKIIKFEGCYHGHSDMLLVQAGSGSLTFGVPTSPGVIKDATKHTLVCTYNDIDSVKHMVQSYKNEIAALIIEPVAANMGLVPAEKEFLQAIRNICDEEGIVLIFDEVISGFRLGLDGAAGYYGIQPDMVCFGKIIGGGLPVGAYAGKVKYMDMVAPSGDIYQAGTLSGNPLAMHVGYAQLNYLKQHPEIYTQVHELTAYFANALRDIVKTYQAPIQVQQLGSLITIFFHKKKVKTYQDVMQCDVAQFHRYFQKMLEKGILLSPSQYEVLFISAAHTKAHIDQTLQAFKEVMEELYG